MVAGRASSSTGLVLAGAAGAAAVTGAILSRSGGTVLVAAALLGLAFAILAVHDVVGALAVFIVLSFVEQIPGAGSGVTVVKGVGAVIALVWVLGLLRRRWTLAPLLGARLLFAASGVALVLWAADSALWASDRHVALSTTSRLAQGVLLSFVIVTCLPDRRALRIALGAFVAGTAVSAVLGLAGVAGAVASTSPGASADVRVGGGLGDPNYLAAVLVPAIFCALGLRETVRGRAMRFVLLVTLAVLTVALLRTESRGGFVALLASAGAAVVVGGALRRRILTSVGTVAVAGAVYFALFASSASLHRVLGAGGGSGRTELWGVALKAFGAHPLAGVGAGNFSVVEPAYAAATNTNLTKPYLELDLGEVVHNTYLHLLAELGVVGLALFAVLVLTALVLCLRACRTFARNGEPELETLSRGLLVGAIGMLVAFAFLTAQYEKQLWIVLALLLVTHVVSSNRSGGRCRAPTS
ncbi:MAG TPA: O-antigen ligase family protein [Gaiellaceae bacterium]